MRKNQLIKLLQKIKGNPEVKFNTPIIDVSSTLETHYLYKRSVQNIKRQLIFHELSKDSNEPLDHREITLKAKRIYRTEQYEESNPFISDKELKRYYGTRKQIIVLKGDYSEV